MIINEASPKIKIRKAKYCDIRYIIMIQKLANISNIIRGASMQDMTKLVFSSDNYDLDYYQQKLLTLLGYVVEYNGSIIGCGFLVDNPIYFEIQTVYIEPSFQGQGFGRRLIEYFITKAKLENKKYLELETATAEGFYRKLGFYDIADTFKLRLDL